MWDEGEWNAEASRGKREKVADHTPILPSHSSPAHVRSSLHCSVAVSESRWLQGQPSQALHYFSGVQQVRFLLWITSVPPPALARCRLWEPRRSRHRAPRSVLEAAGLSTPCKTDNGVDRSTLCISSEQEGCVHILADLKMWNVL